jgi:hypothetical protein
MVYYYLNNDNMLRDFYILYIEQKIRGVDRVMRQI